MSSREPIQTATPLLIIDDHSAHLETLAAILEQQQIASRRCQTGQEALMACTQQKFDVAILDLRLPDMDGIDVLRRLKEHAPQIKIIIHTGYASMEAAIDAVNHGAFAFMRKMDDVDELLDHIHEAYLQRHREDLEEELKKRNEELLLINQKLANEIAERKKAEEESMVVKEYLDTILFTLPVGVAIVEGPEFRYFRINQKLAEINGVPVEAHLGKPLVEVLPQAKEIIVPELHRIRETGEPVLHREFSIKLPKDPDHDTHLIDWLIPIQGKDLKPIAIAAVVLDVTELRDTQAQLRQSQKMEAIGTLAGGIAHEFNNVLGAILGYTDLALHAIAPDTPPWQHLQKVRTAGNRATGLVKQILTFSRQSDQERKPVQLHFLVAEVLTLLRVSLPTTIEMQQHMAQDVGAVLADPTQMHQVLMNLCTNAAHAMRDTNGVLHIGLDTVEIDAAAAAALPPLHPGPHVRLTVRDTGHGMAPEVIERIFDPFFTTKGVGEGTGMGLSVVHGILVHHGGAITVESTPGQGTTFAIYLPRIEATVENEDGTEEEIPPAQGCILFVDDDVMLARLGQATLEQLGYEVVCHTSSIKALEVFRAMPQRFDLVITDQTMPHMTGEHLSGELRRIRPDIPIILCTGFSHMINAEKARALGIDAFCLKPVLARELAVTIQQVLARSSE